MIQGIEMERVVVTLLAFLNPPIDWVPMGVILRNRRWGSMDEPLKTRQGLEGHPLHQSLSSHRWNTGK